MQGVVYYWSYKVYLSWHQVHEIILPYNYRRNKSVIIIYTYALILLILYIYITYITYIIYIITYITYITYLYIT